MIYLQHFGLREPPFGITPDTGFFYACSSMQAALNTLLVALSNGEGFIKIIGEVGTGKTLLCRKLLSSLDESWVSVYIPNPVLDPKALIATVAEELAAGVADMQAARSPGVQPPDLHNADQRMLIKSIFMSLLGLARHNKRVVVCLDEAQAMPIETLETLRLLTNLETEKRKLLQVILFGQPELDQRLATEDIRQLRQRITFQHNLGGFTRDETERYLSHRMQMAGGVPGRAVFSRAAAGSIFSASRGVPRLINILANKSLMLAYGEGVHEVGRREVRAAVTDTPAATQARTRALWVVWLVLAVCAAAGLGWFAMGWVR